jgi:plastocyanin
MAAYTPTATGASEGSSGTGATHTVIVAPTQGVLRFVPFAVNASVGDTIMFMWGANNHTVTKSSALTPCNKSTDALFTSGTQNKGFTFTQVVNDTNPTFYYCGTVGHCQKGMFGIINPPNAFAASTSVSAMMQPLAANNSDVAAYSTYSSNLTSNNANASKWGGSIDMSSLPDWSHEYIAENVLYTRNFLASNPDVLKEDGTVDLSGSSSTPLMFPQDLNNALSATTQSSPSSGASPSSTASTSSSASSSSSSGTSENLSNAAGSIAASKLLVGGVAMLAGFLLI